MKAKKTLNVLGAATLVAGVAGVIGLSGAGSATIPGQEPTVIVAGGDKKVDVIKVVS